MALTKANNIRIRLSINLTTLCTQTVVGVTGVRGRGMIRLWRDKAGTADKARFPILLTQPLI